MGHSEYGGPLDGLEHDLHRETVQTLQRQRIAGDDVVLNDEIHQCLLIVIAVSDGSADLLALQALPAQWDGSHCLPRLDAMNLGESLCESRLNNQPCFRILATEQRSRASDSGFYWRRCVCR